MTRFWLLGAVVAVLSAPSVSQPAPEPKSLQDLSGLWAAKKWFGPEVRGQLVIMQTPDGLRAEIAGRYAPVTKTGGEIAFQLAGDEGRFSGTLDDDGAIRGHWVRPPTALSWGRAESPVVLKSIGPGRWSGTVEPGSEEFSFYIFAKRAADGTYDAILRNPEFDLGNQRGVRRLVRQGDRVKLLAGRGSAEDRVLSSGYIEPDLEGFSLTFAGRGGTYDCHRDGSSSLVYPRPRPSPPYRYEPPPELPDGWRTGTLASENIDRPAM